MNLKDFTAYIALGDSMSIDYYPAVDKGLPVDTPIGAASLLYRNDDQLWSEFTRRDLLTANPGIVFANLTADGATTFDLLDESWFGLVKRFASDRVLATLTIGGNDALRLLGFESYQMEALIAEVGAIVDRYNKVVSLIRETLPDATIILATIYDPSDGTGVLPGRASYSDKLPFLDVLNKEIAETASATRNCLLADVHKHFHGHGVRAKPCECYYWAANPIEPSALGASELRRLWC
jgi:lysophospholipase L1-like esterase